MSKHLSLVGVGTLGKAIALRLQRSGFHVDLFNRTVSKAEGIANQQLVAVTSFPELFSGERQIILICLKDAGAIRSLFCMPDIEQKLVEARPLILNVSTIGPLESQWAEKFFRTHGAHYTECPVSGGPEGALAGKLAAWIGDLPASVKETLLAVVGCLSDHYVVVGSNRVAQAMKVINNYCEALHLLVSAEALLIAERIGISHDMIRQALLLGRGRSIYMEVMLERYLQPSREILVPLDIRLKDLDLAGELFQKYGVDSEFINYTRNIYIKTAAKTSAKQDQTACFDYLSDVLYRQSSGRLLCFP